MKITETKEGAFERLIIGIISFAALGVATMFALAVIAGCSMLVGMIYGIGRLAGLW